MLMIFPSREVSLLGWWETGRLSGSKTVCLRETSGESPWIDRARQVHGRTILLTNVEENMEEELIVLGAIMLSSVSFTLIFQRLFSKRK